MTFYKDARITFNKVKIKKKLWWCTLILESNERIDSTISFISIFTASLFSRGILVDEYSVCIHKHDMTTSTSSAECLRLIGPSASSHLQAQMGTIPDVSRNNNAEIGIYNSILYTPNKRRSMQELWLYKGTDRV